MDGSTKVYHSIVTPA